MNPALPKALCKSIGKVTIGFVLNYIMKHYAMKVYGGVEI
jgi:hypothetical protein